MFVVYGVCIQNSVSKYFIHVIISTRISTKIIVACTFKNLKRQENVICLLICLQVLSGKSFVFNSCLKTKNCVQSGEV